LFAEERGFVIERRAEIGTVIRGLFGRKESIGFGEGEHGFGCGCV
jgi:hypothetical protein